MINSIQIAALLLERVSATTKRFEEQYRKTGMAYNIFKVAGIGEKEVRMCRVLTDLLSPKGLHYQGSTYLKLFMDMVVYPFITKAGKLDLSKASVTAEYSIDEGRRIDIVLDDGKIFIPIEVKIYAGEQEQQIADYYSFSRKMNTVVGSIPVLFLTPDGYESDEAARDEYVPISFKKHIIPWLKKCLNLEETANASPVREILKQFIKAIKSFCGQMEDEEMENAINALVAESRDSYLAALSISKAVNDIDNKNWKIFKGEIKELVRKKIFDAEYFEDNGWFYLYFPIGNGCGLSVNYDMCSFEVDHVDMEITVMPKTIDAIRKTMSSITGIRDYNYGDANIWSTENARYPGFEKADDDIYAYELYQIYSKNPQSVADKIVSWVMVLKNI